MDLLLQAAKVLELENSGSGVDRVLSKATRGTHFHQYAKTRSENSENSDGSVSYSENGVGVSEDDIPPSDRRRSGGANTREVHNQLEKNRRKQLRECFNHLQQCVPSLENKRVATQSILQGAIKHIKHLKKKDIEQEREIQMLAKKKSELKKRYDVELNKSTEEQQRFADVLLKEIKAETDDAPDDDDGHTSDSTTTASEGPCNEDDLTDDDERELTQPVKSNLMVKVEGSRKRKLGPRTPLAMGGRTSDLPSNGGNVGASSQHLSSKTITSTSSVSSSSMALKQMLEQRKKNQVTSLAQVNTLSTNEARIKPPAATTRIQGKPVLSLTSSYPMISNHLASALKPRVAGASHPLITQANNLIAQSPKAAFSNSNALNSSIHNSVNASAFVPPTIAAPAVITTESNTSASAALLKSKKTEDSFASKNPQGTLSMVIPSTPSSQNVSSIASPVHSISPGKLPYNAPIFPSSITLLTNPMSTLRTPAPRKIDPQQTNPSTQVSTVSAPDAQSINFLSKNVIGSSPGAVSMQPLSSVSQPLDSSTSKVLPAVIPVSLTSFIRNLPINSGVSPIVTLATTPIALSTPSASLVSSPSANVASAPIFTNKIQPGLNASLLLTAPTKSEPTHIGAVPLPHNNARIATLLAAPSSNINNSVIKPTSPASNTTTLHVSTSLSTPSTSIPIPDSLKTVTITPTILPLSLSSGPLGASPSPAAINPGTPLRFFAPLQHSSMMAASLTNGQASMMPAVFQLGTSGQVALLQNLIPTQHVQVQSPHHHLLAQPIVVMTTPGPNFTGTSASTPNVSVTSSSSLL